MNTKLVRFPLIFLMPMLVLAQNSASHLLVQPKFQEKQAEPQLPIKLKALSKEAQKTTDLQFNSDSKKSSVINFDSLMKTGTNSGGGGDPCEDRINEIRHDLKSWIFKKGHESLKLPNRISIEQYSVSMLKEIQKAEISCVYKKSDENPVTVQGIPKVCRFDKVNELSRITCDANKFMSLLEENQYKLIHHEYAGLADIEKPDGANSNYDVSSQISMYLQTFLVKKLVVKPFPSRTLPNSNSILCSYTGLTNYGAVIIPLEELESGKCEIKLPSKLKGYSFRIYRKNNGVLKYIVENKMTNLNLTLFGVSDLFAAELELPIDEAKEISAQLGYNVTSLKMSCEPSYGREADSFLPIKGGIDCN